MNEYEQELHDLKLIVEGLKQTINDLQADKHGGMSDLTVRNFQAMSQGLKSVRAQCELLEEEIKAMRAANSQLQQMVTALQQQNGILLARFHGTGSTS